MADVPSMADQELIAKALEVLHYRELSSECVAGEVSAALLTDTGNLYTGVSISAACGIGFCAEHSAIAQMVTQGESRIIKIVAISGDGRILPPCGRCRELMYQVNVANLEAEILLGSGRRATLSQLLPERWQDAWS
ncbi:MAG: cytidine deaminase family protein [Anaerolineae bacterium]